MNIEKLGDKLVINIIIRRYANQSNRYTASFEDTETKEKRNDCGLSGKCGSGTSAKEAINDYTGLIQGKWLVINAMGDKRREFGVPGKLGGV